MASLKDTYFLILNQPGNLQGGTSVVSTSGFGLLLGDTGSVNFGNRTAFFRGFGGRVDPYGAGILGGDLNGLSGDVSVLVGGQGNRILGGYWSFLGGGKDNSVCVGSAFLGAGQNNKAQVGASWSVIGGGASNCTYGMASTIAGGEEGHACTYSSFIGGGRRNCAGNSYSGNPGYGSAWYASITAGYGNLSTAFGSHIDGGITNYNSGCWSIIAGGGYNKICGSSSCFNSIVGGNFNSIITRTGPSTPTWSSQFAKGHSILGGESNYIEGHTVFSTILGGWANYIISGDFDLILSSQNSKICNLSHLSTILGGYLNCIDGYNINTCLNTIVGGRESFILSSNRSSIINSESSRICSGNSYSNIFGGRCATISLSHVGASLLTDGENRSKLSSGSNTLTLDFKNGVYFSQTGVFGLINFSTRPRVNGTGVLLSGEATALPTTIVYTTGNQNISGSKTFNTRPNVNGTGVLLIGEGSNVSVQNVVYTTGNQEIDGLKYFYTTPQVNGTEIALVNNVVDLANYQVIDGLKYFYTTPQVNGTDVALSDNVVDLSNNQYINGLKYFYTTPQVNGVSVALSNDVVNLTSSQTINGNKDFDLRPTVNGVGVLLIGEGGGAGSNVVYITGDQIITGNKTFDHGSTTTISNLAFRSTSGQLRTFSFVQQSGTLTQQIDYINNNVWIARGGAQGIYNIKSEAGWNSSISPEGTSWNLDGWNDLSNLDSRNYSGFYQVNGNNIGANVTGKQFIMKDAVSDRYYKIYFTGWQVGQGNQPGYRGFGYTRQEVGPRAGALLSGQAVFDQRPIVSGRSVLIEGDIQGGGLVSTTGDQNISGLKNFATIPQVNGTGVLLFGQASPSPIAIFDNGSSQGNASSLNFVGGGISVNTVGAQATITVVSSSQTLTVPTSSNSAGVSGAFAISDDYFYFCKRPNKWVRTALSEW